MPGQKTFSCEQVASQAPHGYHVSLSGQTNGESGISIGSAEINPQFRTCLMLCDAVDLCIRSAIETLVVYVESNREIV